MKHGEPKVRLGDLIEAALTNKRYNQQRLGKQAQSYVDAIIRVKAPDLPEDLHHDVFSEAFAQLFSAGSHDLSRLGGQALFRRAVLAAIRKVRADYAPAGQRTRHKAAGEHDLQVAAGDADRVVDPLTLDAISVDEGVPQAPDFDRLPDPASLDIIAEIHHALEVNALLAKASVDVATALRQIHFEEVPVDTVADEMGISRFSLNRKLKLFYEHCRMAA